MLRALSARALRVPCHVRRDGPQNVMAVGARRDHCGAAMVPYVTSAA